MLESRATITTGGRVVIPASIRKQLNLQVGEEVVLQVERGELRIKTIKMAIEYAQALVRAHNKKKVVLSEALIASRRKEAKDEE